MYLCSGNHTAESPEETIEDEVAKYTENCNSDAKKEQLKTGSRESLMSPASSGGGVYSVSFLLTPFGSFTRVSCGDGPVIWLLLSYVYFLMCRDSLLFYRLLFKCLLLNASLL